ncbi:hypothetical protein G9C98_000023 [Cotesia typhae]|uniref:NADH dehydrogenase [ubiquinone] 1 alpha subcomplex subunit 11 n=1 Tax=Cotesia typhae TaxID=2053667 RepID=A0A8J5UTV1_9HYME|nr:hypothetical protein G9C98_000023 [Cotesia typhae]
MDKYKPWQYNGYFRLLAGPGYYDKPEGTDPVGKLWGINKYAIASGIFFGLGDSLIYTQTKNVLETINCFGYYIVPFVGLASAFACGTYISTDLRKKDDRWNYVVGALSCMPVLYSWKKTASFTFWGTGLLLFAALVKKDSIVNEYSFLNVTTHYKYGNYKYDMSLVSKEWPRRPI